MGCCVKHGMYEDVSFYSECHKCYLDRRKGSLMVKVNLSVSQDGKHFEVFDAVEFPELNAMTEAERKVFVEKWAEKAAGALAEKALSKMKEKERPTA